MDQVVVRVANASPELVLFAIKNCAQGRLPTWLCLSSIRRWSGDDVVAGIIHCGGIRVQQATGHRVDANVDPRCSEAVVVEAQWGLARGCAGEQR